MAVPSARAATTFLTDFYNLLAVTAAIAPRHDPNMHSFKTPPKFDDGKVAKILDALALICVQEVSGQTCAVAAEIEYSPQAPVVRLTVVENKGADQTENHLHRVWGILQKAARRWHRHPPPRTNKNSQPEFTKEIYCELGYAVFSHSFNKFERRIKKANGACEKLRVLLRPIVIEKGCSEWDKLVGMMIRIKKAAEDCTMENIAGNSEYFLDIHLLPYYCRAVFDPKKGWMGKLAKEFVEFDGGVAFLRTTELSADVCVASLLVVDFERKVRKVADIQKAMETLLHMTGSRRMYRLFESDLQVDMKKPESVDHQLPVEEAGWEAVLERATYNSDLEKGGAWTSEVQKVLKRYSGDESKGTCRTCFVHCEVSIINHFAAAAAGRGRGRGRKRRRPIPYIGVSKLPCGSCVAFLQAHNDINQDTRFYMRGVGGRGGASSGGKWCFPWKLPDYYSYYNEDDNDNEEKSVMKYMYDGVLDDLQEHLLGIGALKSKEYQATTLIFDFLLDDNDFLLDDSEDEDASARNVERFKRILAEQIKIR